MSSPRDVLRTTKVDVHRITVGLEQLSGCEEMVGVVGAELDNQGSVFRPTLFAMHGVKVLLPVRLPYAFCVHLTLPQSQVDWSKGTQWQMHTHLGIDHGRIHQLSQPVIIPQVQPMTQTRTCAPYLLDSFLQA